MTSLDIPSRTSRCIEELETLGYDLSSVREQRRLREATSVRSPSEHDKAFPLQTPNPWTPHFESSDTVGEPPLLSNSTLRVGARLRLTPGQRQLLRERYEMTPTKVVEVVNIELFEGTHFIKELVLASDLHVPEVNRKRILKHCRISDFGAWYCSAVELDKQKEEGKATQEPRAQPSKSGADAALSATALADLYV